MMNPAEATHLISDKTVDRVYRFFANPIRVLNERRTITDIQKVNILNLFSIYNPTPSHLNQDFDAIINISHNLLMDVFDENNTVIEDTIFNNSDYIIMGWGMPDKGFHLPIYYKQVSYLLKLIRESEKESFAFRVQLLNNKRKRIHITKEMNPVHPGRLNIRALVKVAIDPYLRINTK